MAQFFHRFGRMPKFVRNALISFPIRILGLILQFATSILIARLVGPAEFGAYSYAFVWAAVVSLALGLGLGQLALREIPQFVARNQGGTITGFLMALAVTLMLSTTVLGLIFWWLETRGILVLAPGWALVTALALVQAVALALASVMGGFQMILTAQVMENLPRQSLFLIALLGAVWMGLLIDPTLLVELQIWVAIPVYALTLAMLWRGWRRAVATLGPVQLDLKTWYTAGLPMAFTSFANFLNNYVDILMIGTMLDDTATGIYRAASRAALLVMVCQLITQRVLGPMLSRALANDDRAGAQRLLAYAAGITALGVFAISAVLIIWSDFYLGLFGPAFVAGAPALVVLLVGQIIARLFGAVSILALFTGRQNAVFVINVVGLAVNFLLNWILIRQFGIVGAAYATAISLVGVNIAVWVMLRRKGEKLDSTIASTVRLALGYLKRRRA